MGVKGLSLVYWMLVRCSGLRLSKVIMLGKYFGDASLTTQENEWIGANCQGSLTVYCKGEY